MENKDNKQKFTGKVVWFSASRGIGFLARDDGKKDIFCHYSDINMEGYKLLLAGDIVTFEEDTNFNNKLKAANIVVVERSKGKK